MKDEDRDWFHLRQILRIIAHIERRLANFEEPGFLADRDEIDLTAFRLQVIGEAVRRLSASLKARRSDVRWAAIMGMRNFIAHDYEGIDTAMIWGVAQNELGILAEACRSELAAMGENEPDPEA